jgi:hypothetical protein
MRDQVVPTPDFIKPAVPRLPVHGQLDAATNTALQIFVGLDAKRGMQLRIFICRYLQSQARQILVTWTFRPLFSK